MKLYEKKYFQSCRLKFFKMFCATMLSLVSSNFIWPQQSPSFPGDETVCLSLKALANAAKINPYEKNVKTLAGIGNLDGYIIDPATQDIILFGKRSEEPTTLTLDDLVVNIRNVWNDEPYPYCSLDPLPQNILKLNEVSSSSGNIQGKNQMKILFKKLKEALGPQTVVVGGVPRNSMHAHAMIDADYHMKKVSQGLVKINNVRSCIDILSDNIKNEFEETGSVAPMGMSMSRFWFHVGAGEPIFMEGDGILFLEKCSVVILTEKQKSSADGSLHDSGEENPDAETFARELSSHFREVAGIENSYANLENIFRLSAVLRAIYFRNETDKCGFNINYFLNSYKYKMESAMPPSLPGLANFQEYTFKKADQDAVYEYYFFPMVCGGVSMEIPVNKKQFHSINKAAEDKIKNRIISARPNTGSLYWTADIGKVEF